MLIVPTIVQPSPIHGLGLFSVEQIAAGTLVWIRDPFTDFAIPCETLLYFYAEPLRSALLKYSYIDPRNPTEFVICADDARHLNFSDQPNCVEALNVPPPSPLYALRDIAAGEELTVGSETDADAARKLARQP